MKYIIIGDNYKSIKTIINQVDEEIIEVPRLEILETVKYIETLHIDRYDIFIINSEGLFAKKDNHTDNNGILLLKWLRIHLKILNRIFMMGFISREDLLQNNPKDYILFAPSNYFLQLPFNIDKFNLIKLNSSSLKSEEALIKKYKTFIKADFDIQQFGHSFANKFGLYALENIHKALFSKFQMTNFNSSDIFEFEKALLIYNFNLNNPKEETINVVEHKNILFVDDQEDLGWSNLLKSIFKDNNITITAHKPNIKTNYVSEILNKTTKLKPDLILLDLRFGGDSESNLKLEEVSGFKTLKALKNLFPSLPIIMFSATNKAETLQKILQAKAFGLWSKPRIESKLVLDQKYYDLIKIVNDALNIFNTELEKWLFEVDFYLSKIKMNSDIILTEIEAIFENNQIQFLSNTNVIIFDTNSLIYVNDTKYDLITNKKNAINRQIVFFITCLIAEKYNKRIVIIDDVMDELFRHSKTSKDEDIKKISIYVLNKIFKYKDVIDSEFHTIENLFRKTNFVFDNKNKKYRVWSDNKRLISVFNSKEEATDLINVLKNKKKKELHADYTFKFLILHYLVRKKKKKNVLFISDDLECKYETYHMLKNTLFNSNGSKIKKGTNNKIKNAVIVSNNNKCEIYSMNSLTYELVNNSKIIREFTV